MEPVLFSSSSFRCVFWAILNAYTANRLTCLIQMIPGPQEDRSHLFIVLLMWLSVQAHTYHVDVEAHKDLKTVINYIFSLCIRSKKAIIIKQNVADILPRYL